MQRFEILTRSQLEKIHETSLRILEQIGVDFSHAPAREVLKKGGAKIDGQRVFIPRRLVEEQIKKPPAEFTILPLKGYCGDGKSLHTFGQRQFLPVRSW